MATHLAILLRPYVDLILNGRKTIESRLTRAPLPPFRQIEPGDRIIFKVSSGPIAATAVAQKVRFYENMTPRDVQTIRQRYNDDICGEPAYWRIKRYARYATLVRLGEVQATDEGPDIKSQGWAWMVLDQKTWPAPKPKPGLFAPLVQVTLTDAACRNCYVRPPAREFVEPGSFELLLPDGVRVESDLYRGMIRWRGWRRYFQQHGMAAGDVVELTATGEHRYRVQFTHRSRRR